MDLEDKLPFEEGESVSHVNIELDLDKIKGVIEDWAAKNSEEEVEAQSSPREAHDISLLGSGVNNQMNDSEVAENDSEAAGKKIRASSRKSKAPAWMVDYV